MSPLDVPGHSDHMGSESWRIETVSRIEQSLEGCSDHGRN
jgi:hypothetical protein